MRKEAQDPPAHESEHAHSISAVSVRDCESSLSVGSEAHDPAFLFGPHQLLAAGSGRAYHPEGSGGYRHKATTSTLFRVEAVVSCLLFLFALLGNSH